MGAKRLKTLLPSAILSSGCVPCVDSVAKWRYDHAFGPDSSHHVSKFGCCTFPLLVNQKKQSKIWMRMRYQHLVVTCDGHSRVWPIAQRTNTRPSTNWPKRAGLSSEPRSRTGLLSHDQSHTGRKCWRSRNRLSIEQNHTHGRPRTGSRFWSGTLKTRLWFRVMCLIFRNVTRVCWTIAIFFCQNGHFSRKQNNASNRRLKSGNRLGFG